MTRVDVVIQPFVLRLSLYRGAPIYHVASDPWVQLDGAEEALRKSPADGAAFGELAFIPICQTVLIRGRKTILVDPGNLHLGISGALRASLRSLGIGPDEIDIVVATHAHHDHLSAIASFRGRPLVIGAPDLRYLAETYWPAYADAFTRAVASEIWEVGAEPLALEDGVTVIPTPGHTPGSVSVLVETVEDRIAIVGDCAMTQEEYETRRLSHWYTDDQIRAINESLDRIVGWGPSVVFPGHDRAFRPGGRQYDARQRQWPAPGP
jgi:glyoxylase-like metal-dependent hydrolase (beta-lactamase superfamily II)